MRESLGVSRNQLLKLAPFPSLRYRRPEGREGAAGRSGGIDGCNRNHVVTLKTPLQRGLVHIGNVRRNRDTKWKSRLKRCKWNSAGRPGTDEGATTCCSVFWALPS